MKSRRAVLSAIALVVALLSASAAPLLAATAHRACATSHHACGTTARIASCCCGHDDAADNEPGAPAQSQIELRVSAAPCAVATGDAIVAPPPRAVNLIHPAPPPLSRLDLPTLFSTLLI